MYIHCFEIITLVCLVQFYFCSVGGTDISPFGNVPVLVRSSGKVLWFPPTHVEVRPGYMRGNLKASIFSSNNKNYCLYVTFSSSSLSLSIITVVS